MTLPLAQPLNLEEREVFSLKEVTSVSRENLSPSALYGVLWTEGAFLCRERAGFSIYLQAETRAPGSAGNGEMMDTHPPPAPVISLLGTLRSRERRGLAHVDLLNHRGQSQTC